MKILLTGASGFLGKNLAARLKKDGHNILQTAKKQADNTVSVDLLDYRSTKNIIEDFRPEVIFHCGAIVNLSRNLETAEKCIDINIKGSLNLLEACRAHPPKKFIHTSTEEIYGNSSAPFKESSLPQPPSMYSISKLAVENLSAGYGKEIGFIVRSIRLATMYGFDTNTQRMVPSIVLKALKNEPVELNSGKKKRDYLYIEDAVECMVRAMTCETGETCEVINAGGGRSYSLEELAKKVIAVAESDSELRLGVFPDRVNESDLWLMDISKAKKILNWEPKMELIEGIKKTVDYYRKSII